MTNLDDILIGKWGGVRFANERFEQDEREITEPEELDFHEKKAAIKLWAFEIYGEALKEKSVDNMSKKFRDLVERS